MQPLLHCFSLLLLVCDLSYGTSSLVLSSSPNTNGSYCPGRVTFTCVGIDVPIGVGWRINGSIIDDYLYSFRNRGNEKFPEVFRMDENATIIVQNLLLTSASTHNITIDLNTNVSDFLYSTVNCRTATQESNSFVILPSVPEIPNNIMVDPVYNLLTKTLTAINVFWNTMNESCMDYFYQVILTNGSISLGSENIKCRRDAECQFTYMITSDMFERYVVQVVTLNFQGLAVNTSILPPIDYVSSILPNISVEFLSCYIRCNSDSNEIGTCIIEFPEGSVSGTVNSENIKLPESLQSGTVNYSATFNIDGRTYKFNSSGKVQYNRKWTAGILTCAILTPVFCFLSIILIISLGVCLHKRINGHSCYPVIIVCAMLPSIISVLVSLSCWIAGLAEVARTDNCGSVDQPQNILIAACFFSILSSIFAAAIGLVPVCINHPKSSKSKDDNPEVWQDKNHVKKMRTDEMGMLVNEEGTRVVEEHIGTSGHRHIGESTTIARFRVAEEQTREAKRLMAGVEKEESPHKSETESNVYSQTKHVGPSSNQKTKPKRDSNYSNMGKKPAVSPGDKHYAKLQHNNSASLPSAVSPPGAFTTATTASGGSMPLSTLPGYSQVGGMQPSELPPNVNKAANAGRGGSDIEEYGKLESQEKTKQETTARNGRRKAEEKNKKEENATTQKT